MITKIFSTLTFICVCVSTFAAPVNMDDMAQDFVLEQKRIIIPECADAFNPTMIYWDNRILMCFRCRDPKTKATNRIGAIWLDDAFDPISPPQLLTVPIIDPLKPSERQDPRLVESAGEYYIAYNETVTIEENRVRRMFLSKLHLEGDQLTVEPPQSVARFKGENLTRHEKNWTPFDYNGTILLSYSILPHRIMNPVPGTNTCEEIASTQGDMTWNWGELRGGTQAVKVGNQYLSFFHSSKDMKSIQSKDKKITHYFMGAYTFSAEPPFAITQISKEPIIGKSFYDDAGYKTWKPLRGVFSGGFVSDDRYIWVSYGKQDHELWIVKLDKEKLFQNLVPVESQ